MNIMLGNLTVKQIEERTGITLTYEHRQMFREDYSPIAEKIPSGKWHCFDIPFVMVFGDKATAEKYVVILQTYDWSKCKEPFRISWQKRSEEE